MGANRGQKTVKISWAIASTARFDSGFALTVGNSESILMMPPRCGRGYGREGPAANGEM